MVYSDTITDINQKQVPQFVELQGYNLRGHHYEESDIQKSISKAINIPYKSRNIREVFLYHKDTPIAQHIYNQETETTQVNIVKTLTHDDRLTLLSDFNELCAIMNHLVDPNARVRNLLGDDNERPLIEAMVDVFVSVLSDLEAMSHASKEFWFKNGSLSFLDKNSKGYIVAVYGGSMWQPKDDNPTICVTIPFIPEGTNLMDIQHLGLESLEHLTKGYTIKPSLSRQMTLDSKAPNWILTFEEYLNLHIV